MIQKHQYLSIFVAVFFCAVALLVIIKLTGRWESVRSQILGVVSEFQSPPDVTVPIPGVVYQPTEEPKSVTVIPTAEQIQINPTEIPIQASYSVILLNVPDNLIEGGVGTFTWNVNGPGKIIKKTGVFYGTTSHPGNLDLTVSPAETGYTGAVSDFLNGEYYIPLRFVGNMKTPAAGTYYCRAYALIGSDNYWTDEQTFTVKSIPKNVINIVNPPNQVKHGENVAFTWDISGPAAVTNFTVIVAGKTSTPGPLDTSVAMTQTQYGIIAKDFSNGTYNVPLRFIGNGVFPDAGTYYFRALAFIDNKNIWSDEYTLTAQ